MCLYFNLVHAYLFGQTTEVLRTVRKQNIQQLYGGLYLCIFFYLSTKKRVRVKPETCVHNPISNPVKRRRKCCSLEVPWKKRTGLRLELFLYTWCCKYTYQISNQFNFHVYVILWCNRHPLFLFLMLFEMFISFKVL